jgi:hypothetical protein
MLASDAFRPVDGWISWCIVAARWLQGGKVHFRYSAVLLAKWTARRRGNKTNFLLRAESGSPSLAGYCWRMGGETPNRGKSNEQEDTKS